ncbi:hypothetical protein [Effusibacillus consociatus]|uniref:Uncharacterized protein n=1 Tax=Effusibacillus consociatus TaxID=1117041 RepID=A0ABV9PWL6_9BACL
MVIQPNMPVSGIVTAWEATKPVFVKYGISVDTDKTLEEAASGTLLNSLLQDLNESIGSSTATCVEGG